ncbi:MAG: ShlB/FhaC/HecB family hemolysin secretion/activation protein [Alphaproteobacteria bacterium]
MLRQRRDGRGENSASDRPRATLARLFAAALALWSIAASAQQLPGPADPEFIQRRFETPPAPLSTEEPVVAPRPDQQQPPANAETIRFTLTGVVVEGATVYPQDAFLPLYQSLLNTEVSLKDVYGIAQAITAKYTRDGYVLSLALVPAQRIGSGIVHIQVVEGYVDKVIYEGEEKQVTSLVRSIADKIAHVRPLKLSVLERYLLLLDDLPGMTARGVLRPSSTPGASDLVVVVERKLFDGFASSDNRGSRFIGPYEFSLGGNGNSVLGLDERTGLRGIMTSQTKELRLVELTHDEPLFSEGTRLLLSVIQAWSDPGFTLSEFNITSNQTTGSAAVSHPFIRSRAENLSGRAQFDVKNVTVKQNDGATLVSDDRVRAARFGSSYDFVDAIFERPAVSLFGAQFSQGVNGLGARPSGSPNLSTTGGRSGFTKFDFNGQRLQTLGGGFNLLAAAVGQYSLSTLLASEQFTFGGPQFGRGFDPAFLTGDHGIAGKVELQWGQTVGQTLRDYQLYTFYDFGTIWRNAPQATQSARSSGTSTGVGVRLNILENFSANIELGIPVTGGFKTLSDDDNTKPRVFFTVVGRI